MSVFVLHIENARDAMAAAWRFACSFLELGKRVKVTVEEAKPKRSLEQNARMWAMLTDISRQVEWPVDGRLQKLTPEDWKTIMTAGLTKHQRVTQGIEGGFVMLGESTSRMSVGEMTDLIELMFAFGAEHGVRFLEPCGGWQ